MARIRPLISEPRIRAIEWMATHCERVEFSRALPDGRVSAGMATPEDILGLIDIIDAQRRTLARLEPHVRCHGERHTRFGPDRAALVRSVR